MDYKKGYAILFNAITKTIDILIKAQQQTEDIYINDEPTIIKFVEKESTQNENI